MPRDEERISRIQRALSDGRFEALVCTLPSNVLMLSGYWPVIGNSIAIATREGAVALLVPDDERELARTCRADEIRTFQPGSLENLNTTGEAVRDPLNEINRLLGIKSGNVIGYEGSSFDPVSYASTFIYGAEISEILRTAFPTAICVDATGILERLRSVLTGGELEVLRRACTIARSAFLQTAADFKTGMQEFEIARTLRGKLFTDPGKTERRGGFACCMSGANSAEAYAAYQHTRSRAIAAGDFVLLHCNSYCGGFWTDITRTFCAGKPDPRMMGIMDAVLDAGRTSIKTVGPGIKASAVDHAARKVLENRGFGKAFKHATGHGVGFSAINHNARPRIHPLSDEVLETGMVFNIEPAVYFPDYGGMRHCSMVAVTEDGSELLTSFQERKEDLILECR